MTEAEPDLRIDARAVVGQIEREIRRHIAQTLNRRGAVVALSGGLDSSVVTALCVRALGRERVLGLLLPERESTPESLSLGRTMADSLGIRAVEEDIGPALSALGCYARRDAAISSVIPDYSDTWKCKLVISVGNCERTFPIFHVVAKSPAGEVRRARLPLHSYLQVVAATNFKQRLRTTMEYHYADALRYAVAGTANRLEFELGFFVKNGDGAADIKPIAHLYKTQVWQLGEYLGIPSSITQRAPTSDTYSLPQSQEEFFFGIALPHMDLLLYAVNHCLKAHHVAARIGMTVGDVERWYAAIASMRRSAKYLHESPVLMDRELAPVCGISGPPSLSNGGWH